MDGAVSFKLLKEGVLCKGVRVKTDLKGLEEFTEVEHVSIHKARLDEIEEDWVVVVLRGQQIDSSWITEIEGYSGNLRPKEYSGGRVGKGMFKCLD